jgi:type I restriction enzyme S subunit
MAEQIDSKSPKIRFKGFEGEWEEKALGGLFPITSAARVHKNEWTKSGVPFFRSSDVVSLFKGNDNTKAFISHELYEELSAKVGRIEKGDMLVTGGGSIGIPYLVETDEPLYFKDADLLWFKIREAVDSHYLYTFLSSDPFRRHLKSISHIGTIAHYTVEQAKSTPLRLPKTAPEQTKIGEYFRELDRLIGLHQRKHDKLVTLKKAMLQKMFPQPGTTIPEIRFKGFSGDWVKKKLGDSTTNVASNTLSRANLNYRSGLARNVHYGDILVQYREVLDVQNNGIPFISDDAVATKLKSSNLANGDIVVADAAEDEMVGKCTEIQNVGDQIVLAGLHTIALRPLTNFAPFYLGYYLNSDAFHDQLLPIMQGTKVLSISKTAIKHTAICFPIDEAEQQKIGSYFLALDKLISKHAIQLQKLKQIKSACLEKMFV